MLHLRLALEPVKSAELHLPRLACVTKARTLPCVLPPRSCWGSDPHFRGSYSYLGPDCSPAHVAALAAPVYASSSTESSSNSSSSGGAANGSHSSELGPPVLLFAGEACHVVYIGTMHGAYLTGQQAAESLLQHWQHVQGPLPAQERQQQQQQQ